MSKPLVMERKGHPQNIRITDALEDDKARMKAQKGLISKTATLVTAGISDGELQKLVGETMAPNSEQLNRINKFTRRAVTADEVVAFTTLSCNDLPDRDDDQFTTQCVKDFAALEQPLSPVGKSFMLDHNYSVGNAVGRIFGVDTAKAAGGTFLTNEVYLPNTEQFAPLIEKIDFGIAWAVSVGVMLGKSACSLSWCGAAMSSWGYWCQNGHDKGMYYTEDAEEDNWGYPLPCDSRTKGAEKTLRQFSEPRDFYELSQVFLGAQYHAALEEKAPEFAGAVKTAGTNHFVGASADEARKLPLRHEPEKLSEARAKYEIKESDDGSMNWTDEEGLVWTFDPEDSEAGVLCLGKSATNKSEEDDEDARDQASDEQRSAEEDGEGDQPEPDEEPVGGSDDDPSDEGDEPDASASVDAEEDDEEEEDDSEEEDSDSDDDTEEEKALSKADVLKAVQKAKLGDEHVKAVEDAEDNGLTALLRSVNAKIKAFTKQVGELSEKATLGDAYLKELRADAIDWYVKAHSVEDGPVDTTTFEKMLDRFEGDVELIRSVIEENKQVAQVKFPKTVRRSSFSTDPNERKQIEEPTFAQENDERVKRIHG